MSERGNDGLSSIRPRSHGRAMDARRYSAVVVGASAGGLVALSKILERLPADFALPILLAQHIHASDEGRLARHLDASSTLTVVEPFDKEPIQPGHVYVAPANYHMLVEQNGTIALSVDPRVNWSRPSIDVLFESAAHAWGARLIAIMLSGANQDGADGMREIKARGGLLVAQDPAGAEHPVMPQAAIERAGIEIVLSPQDIGDLLLKLSEV